MSVVLLGSTSGSVTLQEPAVAGSTTINLPATSGTMAVLPTATSVLPEASGGTGTTTGYYGFKNRLINSAMVIDQRNAGASVTQTTGDLFPVDRWTISGSVTSKFTAQQNAGSLSAANRPAGYTNYLGMTSSSAYTVGAGETFYVRQKIEGFNIADLGWGTASAATVTLSFWVRSSLTGTFGGCVSNSAITRVYPFSFSISAADTWEQKTITITGDTTGTWLTTNGVGLQVLFSLGTGATLSGTAGAWTGSTVLSATGATSVVGTNSATFYITGVQLEKGSTATSFDYRPYGTELALCQRYYYKIAPGSSPIFGAGQCYTSTGVLIYIPFKATMRTAPAALEQSGTAADYRVLNSGGSGVTCSSVPTFNSASIESAAVTFTVASGIVAGNASFGLPLSSSAYLAWSAEL